MTAPPRDPAERLDLLAMAHYALGTLWAMVALVPAVWVFVGHELARTPELQVPGRAAAAPPSAVTALALLFLVAGWLGGGLAVWGGRCLAARRRLGVARAAALVLLVFVPFGTVLGWVTWDLLARPAIRDRFAS
jgi:hypothetical protein